MQPEGNGYHASADDPTTFVGAHAESSSTHGVPRGEEVHQSAHSRARRASITAALLHHEQAGHEVAMEESHTHALDGPRPRGRTKWQAWMEAVERCVLLNGLGAAELKFVLKSAKPIRTRTGDTIVQQGAALTGSYMYLIASGRYRAVAQRAGSEPSQLRTYGPRDNFGSAELLCHDTAGERVCSVMTISDGLIWGIPQRVVDDKLRIPPPPSEGAMPDADILAFCNVVELFRILSNERLTQLCRCATLLEVNPGDVICNQTEQARTIYVVLAGSVQTSSSKSEFRLTIMPPATFGESALYADDDLRVRGSTVHAGRTGARLLAFQVAALEAVVGFVLQEASSVLEQRIVLSSAHCGSRCLATGLKLAQIDALLAVMIERTFSQDETVVRQWDTDESLFIVKSGEAAVQSTITAGAETLCLLKRGDVFGESALLAKAKTRLSKRKTCVVARGNTPLVLLVLTQDAFSGLALLKMWQQDVMEYVAGNSISGVDVSIAERLRDTGHAARLNALLQAGEPRSTKVDGGGGSNSVQGARRQSIQQAVVGVAGSLVRRRSIQAVVGAADKMIRRKTKGSTPGQGKQRPAKGANERLCATPAGTNLHTASPTVV